MLDVIAEVEDQWVERSIIRVGRLEVVLCFNDRMQLEVERVNRMRTEREPRGYTLYAEIILRIFIFQ